MGLSTTYANVVLAFFVLSVLYVLMGAYSDYMTDTTPEVKMQTAGLRGRLDTSVRLSSVTTDGNDVIFYVLNDGKTTLSINCTDFYIDRQWVPPGNFDEFTLVDSEFDPGLWNPDETLKMRTDEHPIDPGDTDPHEGRVVACNGAQDTMIFYKTV